MARCRRRSIPASRSRSSTSTSNCQQLLAAADGRSFELQIGELGIELLAEAVVGLRRHAEIALELTRLTLTFLPIREQYRAFASRRLGHRREDHHGMAF